MVELPLVLVGGLLGSAHCIGMCGPIALIAGAGAKAHPYRGLLRQLVFSGGRIFTYGFLGAVAGTTGLWLTQAAAGTPWVSLQSWLAIGAGILLVVIGVLSIVPRPVKMGGTSMACLAGSWLKTLLWSPKLSGVFLAGLFTGFLPCGLVYAFLALAASTGSLLWGIATMCVFGVGTMPLMVATGLGGQWLTQTARRRALTLAACCVIASGVVAVARGAGYLPTSGIPQAEPGCPLCP